MSEHALPVFNSRTLLANLAFKREAARRVMYPYKTSRSEYRPLVRKLTTREFEEDALKIGNHLYKVKLVKNYESNFLQITTLNKSFIKKHYLDETLNFDLFETTENGKSEEYMIDTSDVCTMLRLWRPIYIKPDGTFVMCRPLLGLFFALEGLSHISEIRSFMTLNTCDNTYYLEDLMEEGPVRYHMTEDSMPAIASHGNQRVNGEDKLPFDTAMNLFGVCFHVGNVGVVNYPYQIQPRDHRIMSYGEHALYLILLTIVEHLVDINVGKSYVQKYVDVRSLLLCCAICDRYFMADSVGIKAIERCVTHIVNYISILCPTIVGARRYLNRVLSLILCEKVKIIRMKHKYNFSPKSFEYFEKSANTIKSYLSSS